MPIAVVSLFLLQRTLNPPSVIRRENVRIDYLGATLICRVQVCCSDAGVLRRQLLRLGLLAEPGPWSAADWP
ncbi:hypothetical protein ACRAWF_27135 [Streptomyces sp. L7]